MKKIILPLMFVVMTFNMYSQAYKIDVTFNNLKNQELIIGHHFNSQLIPDDTIKLDNKGYGVFKGNEAFPGGMYFFFLPNKTYFDFLLDDDQQFSVIGDTFDFVNTVSFKGSEENTIFIEYQKNFRDASIRQNDLITLR